MLYKIIKIWIRAGLIFFCRKISFSDRTVLKSRGPLLLACNHPNSFLDAIIVGSHFNRPVHFLARGDIFRKPLAKKVLSALKMIPIYRLSEGREYLALNDATFEQCSDILSKGGIVLIFAEGLCVNQWALRPLKKGAARIAWTAFHNLAIRQQFRVIPVGINYNGFGGRGKRVIVQFEKAIDTSDFPNLQTAGDFIQQFNDLLQASLQNALLADTGPGEIIQVLISNCNDADGNQKIITALKKRQDIASHINILPAVQTMRRPRLVSTTAINFTGNLVACIILTVPALFGWLLHLFLLYPLKKIIHNKTKGTVFYDSVMFGSLLLLYPAYWSLINIISLLYIPGALLNTIVFMAPVWGAVYLAWLDCGGKVFNYLILSRGQKKLLTTVIGT